MLSLISGAQFTNWIKRDTWTIDPSQQPFPLFLPKNNLRRLLEKTDNFNEHFPKFLMSLYGNSLSTIFYLILLLLF